MICFRVSIPFFSGMDTSRSTISHFSARIFSAPSIPLVASAPTSIPPLRQYSSQPMAHDGVVINDKYTDHDSTPSKVSCRNIPLTPYQAGYYQPAAGCLRHLGSLPGCFLSWLFLLPSGRSRCRAAERFLLVLTLVKPMPLSSIVNNSDLPVFENNVYFARFGVLYHIVRAS